MAVRSAQWAALLAAAMALLSPPLQATEGAIVVGSKIDTEGALLCPLVSIALKAHGIKVVEKCGTGATQVVRKALVTGEIDVYPEYTGNAPYLIKNVRFVPGAFRDPVRGHAAGAAADWQQNQIVWLKPAPANVTYGFAIPAKLAAAENIATLTQLAAYINAGKPFKVVVSQEFVDRADGLRAFEQAYGFRLKPSQLIILPGGNTAQTESAAARGTSGANAAMSYSTDGQLAALGLVSLSDSGAAADIYQPLLTIRSEALKKYPAVPSIIDPIFATLDTATLSRLNAQIVVGGLPGARVAEQYLREKGFIQ